MRFIGRKNALLDFIEAPLIKNKITNGKFCDIFSGTTVVAQHFKKKGFKVISNDYMYFSYVFYKKPSQLHFDSVIKFKCSTYQSIDSSIPLDIINFGW